MFSFRYMDRGEFSDFAGMLFELLADNMNRIAPSPNSREEDFAAWRPMMEEQLACDARKIVLIREDDARLVGYFQYSLDSDTFHMEEIQFLPSVQGNGLFRTLYGFVLPKLPDNIRFVEAYAHQDNARSNGILTRLGLQVIGKNRNQTSLHYRGEYRDLLNWLNTV